METEKEKPEMLTSKEVIEYLRISRSTLYNWMEEGIIHPVKIGPDNKRRKLLFRRSDVEKLKAGN